MKDNNEKRPKPHHRAGISPNTAAVTLEPQEMEQICQEYMSRCKESGRIPTKPGLALAIGVLPETLDRWGQMEDLRHKAYTQSIKKCYAAMSDEFQQRKDSMSIFLLKQPSYGGYSDKDTSGMPDNITVNVVFGKDKSKANSAK